MLVKDVMNTDVKTIFENATIQEAAKEMSEFSIGSLIVVKGDTVVGMLTERDVLKKVVGEALDSSTTEVGEIMTKEVIMVKPDLGIDEAADIMMEHRIKKLPVLEGSSLVGIVTSMDLCTASPKMIEKLSSMMMLHKEKKAVAG